MLLSSPFGVAENAGPVVAQIKDNPNATAKSCFRFDVVMRVMCDTPLNPGLTRSGANAS
jgi:hypothetical protein